MPNWPKPCGAWAGLLVASISIACPGRAVPSISGIGGGDSALGRLFLCAPYESLSVDTLGIDAFAM
jgi:hypothetical protein